MTSPLDLGRHDSWDGVHAVVAGFGVSGFAAADNLTHLGAAVIVASVSSLLLYTAWAGPEDGWGSPLGLTLLLGGLALAALFVLVELRATEPIIPILIASTPISPITASICASTISAGTEWTADTPSVFCAVTAVIAVMAWPPSMVIVLISA